MMKVPLLSIIIPAYNAAHSLPKIVTTILKESFKDFELLLVDDGSTDETLKVIRGLASKDKRIIVRAQRNRGPSSARNTGLLKARGSYIQFYDADDAIIPGSLQTIMTAALETKADVVVSGHTVLSESNGKAIKTISPEKTTKTGDEIIPFVTRSIGHDGRLYNLWNKLFRAEIIHQHNLTFREDLRFGEDLVFALHYFKHAHTITTIPNVTYSYVSSATNGVFSSSSIVPEYRLTNDQELTAFVGEERDPELEDLYQWVRWRWLLSYWTLVARSNLPQNEKLNRIKSVSAVSYGVAKTPEYIGKRKYRIEHTTKRLTWSPKAALAFATLLAQLRQGVMNAKSFAKR